jgi:hypothetical protein
MDMHADRCALNLESFICNTLQQLDTSDCKIKSPSFWNITPCSPLKVNRRFGETYSLHLQVRRISRARNQRDIRWQAYSSTLKMEAICYSEMSVDFQRTTRRYIPEDRTIYNHRCENLKSCICFSCLYSSGCYHRGRGTELAQSVYCATA